MESQWSVKNVAMLSAVAALSCLVGYYGALAVNQPQMLYTTSATTVRAPLAPVTRMAATKADQDFSGVVQAGIFSHLK